MNPADNTYYLWKWADNNLPGKPNEVFSELLRGRMHPAVQPFDAQPILKDLRVTAKDRHGLGEEWVWKVEPSKDVTHAKFIFLKCPVSPEYGSWIDEVVFDHGLSGYDEQTGNLIRCLSPKLNQIIFGNNPDNMLCDINADDLPELLGHLSPDHIPWARLASRADHYNIYVQCYAHENGFDLEWGDNCPKGSTDFDHWRAGYPQHLNGRNRSHCHNELRVFSGKLRVVKIHEFPNEKLRFCDVLHIFQAFVREDRRPVKYHWRSIKRELQ